MKHVIVDTSIWINYFKGLMSSAERKKFLVVLENERLVLTNVIFHELMVGSKTQKDFAKLQSLLSPFALLTNCSHPSSELDVFGFRVAKAGLLGRYTDLTIAFLAMKHHLPVWSKDAYFRKLSEKNFIEIFP